MNSNEHKFIDSLREEFVIDDSFYDNDECGEVYKLWGENHEKTKELYYRIISFINPSRVSYENLLIKIR